MKLKVEGAATAVRPVLRTTSSGEVVPWRLGTGFVSVPPARAPSRDAANDLHQTTVLHVDRLRTLDGASLDVVFALHWSLREAQTAPTTLALARSNVKGLAQASMEEVIGRTALDAVLAQHAMLELRLCNRMRGALTGLGIDILGCRLRDVSSTPDPSASVAGRIPTRVDEAEGRRPVDRR